MEPEQHQRHEEHPCAGDRGGPAQAIRGREVEVANRVMHRVRGPEPARLVAHAVLPVVAELTREKEQRGRPSVIERDREQAMVPNPEKRTPNEPCRDEPQRSLAQRDGQ